MQQPTHYRLILTSEAVEMIRAIKNPRTQAQIVRKLNGLRTDPEHQGIALTDELAGLRRIPVAGRYRAIYRVLPLKREVRVVAVGLRRESSRDDIYRILARMIRRGEV